MSSELDATRGAPSPGKAPRGGCRTRILKACALLVALGVASLWPGGPFRPRAASLRSLVPPDVQLVVRLDPAACLDSAFVQSTIGCAGRPGLVDEVFAILGMDSVVAADDALAASSFISELVVCVRDDEPFVLARLTPTAHALAIIDHVFSPPDDVALMRYRDVLIVAPNTDLLPIGDDFDEQPVTPRPFDAFLAWADPPGRSIRLWARPADLLAVVSDRSAADVLGLAAAWLTPSRIASVGGRLTLSAEPVGLRLRLNIHPHEIDSSAVSRGVATDRGTHAAELRALHLAAGNETLWHAGFAGSADQVVRTLLRDRVLLLPALDRLTARLRAATAPGVAVALTRMPQLAGERDAATPPTRFVAAVRLRPSVDDRRFADEMAEHLGAALRLDVEQELTAGGQTLIRVTGPLGPALVIGRGELILFGMRGHDEPLVAAETWSDASGPAERVADVRIDFAAIGTQMREDAEPYARQAIEDDIRARRHGDSIQADLAAAQHGLSGADALRFREQRLREIATRAEREELSAKIERQQTRAARWTRLGDGTIHISTTPEGDVIEVTATPRPTGRSVGGEDLGDAR